MSCGVVVYPDVLRAACLPGDSLKVHTYLLATHRLILVQVVEQMSTCAQ